MTSQTAETPYDRNSASENAAAPLVVFTHIPKAAGTTLMSIVRAQYGDPLVVDVGAVPEVKRMAFMATLPQDVRAVVGHARYGLHEHTSRRCRYFTFLREPVSRVLSTFGYIRRNPLHYMHREVMSGQLDLAAVARRLRDLQTKFVAGVPVEKEVVDAGDLATAKEHLTAKFDAFGLMERFDESLILLADTFSWSSPVYLRENVNPRGSRSSATSDRDREVILEMNQFDIQLFEFARALLDQRIAAQAEEFQHRLTKLRADVELAEKTRPMPSRWRQFLERCFAFIGNRPA
jgi:Sulfotransferase family